MGTRAGGVTAMLAAGVLAPVVALGGCGELFAAEEVPPPPPADVPGLDAGTSPDVEAPPAADAATTCETERLTLEPSADTSLDECAGTINYNHIDYANVKGPDFGAVMRFALREQDVEVLSSRQIVSASLRVVSFPNCGNCTPNGLPARAGTLSVHPMRQDWTEGTDKKNVDRCRRVGDTGWGSGGTAGSGTKIAAGVDYDDVGATADYADDDPFVVVPLTREHLVAREALEQRSIAFFVHSTNQLVIATREKAGDEPTLVIEYCK